MMTLIKTYAPNSVTLKTISDYENKILGIDSNNMIFKGVLAIRRNGYDIKNGDIIVTHIHSILQKLIAFKKYNITPIFVFDGQYNIIKNEEMKKRENEYKKIKNKYDNAKSNEDKKKYYYAKNPISNNDIEDVKELIKIFGYNAIDATEEADSELGYMSKNKMIDYVVSDDMDILVFGAQKLLKNFSVAKNRKITEINLDEILKGMDINYDKFVDLSMMLGCDYCKIKGIGPKTAYKKILNGEYDIDKKIKNYFIDPIHGNINIENNKDIDYQKLSIYLANYGYEDEYINKIKNKINKS